MLLADYWFGCTLTRETIDSSQPQHIGRTGTSDHWIGQRHRNAPRGSDSLPVASRRACEAARVIEIARCDGRIARRGPYVVNRYLDVLRDTPLERLTHVDGAARAYVNGLNKAMNDNPKELRRCAALPEAVRVDGSIDDADRGRVVAHFFRGRLVIQYFGELADERGWARPPDEPSTLTVPAMSM